MSKKNSAGALGIIYLIGMAVALIGFCCPMFSINLGGLVKHASNGFKFIDFENSGFVSIGAILLFAGAVAGVVFGLLSVLKVKLPQAKMLGLIALIVVLAGAIVLIVGFTTNGKIYSAIGKQFLKHATYGFYMVIAGWVVALVGWIVGK